MDQPQRILVIEDSPADFRLVERELVRGGIAAPCLRVDTPADLAAALDSGGWDLVLSDYSVPALNFEATLATLRARWPDMPLILVSGSVGEERAVELLKLGVWDFVLKDNLARLVPAVERSLREAEERRHLKLAEGRLRLQGAALTAAANAILITDRAGAIEWVNPAFTRLSGYSLAEVLGRNPRDLVKSSRQPPEFYAAMWATILSGRTWSGELVNRRKDGSTYLEAQSITPIADETGAIGHFVAIKQDVTEIREAQRALEVHREHLEELVAERTAAFEAARREAERLARVKSEFLANMSHEIRTPLNGVLGLAQIGFRDNAGPARETFARILESGRLLLGIIDDILDFSKIEAGKLKVEAVAVCPARLVDETAELLAERARAKGVALAVDKAADLPAACLSDPLRLGQILMNLLSNAVKFTERGRVTLAAGREGDRLVFRVADTGIGMAREELDRLFTAFEQADGATTRRFGGTGLGLAITRRLTELLGGEISVASEPGRGSTFEVRLPLVEAPAPAAAQVSRPAPAGPRLHGLRILAAEDNDVNRLVLEDLLTNEGARVVMVGNGQQAIDRLAAEPAAFDLVLMDIQMPGMDGFEATRQLHELAPGLPVIGQTAHVLPEDREKCLAAGMVDHLAKPIDLDDLVTLVRRHLGLGDGAPAAAPADPDAAPAPVESLVDWGGLKARYARRPGFALRLASLFANHEAPVVGELRTVLADRDLPRLAVLAHSLKGASGEILATQLTVLARQVEMAAREGSDEAVALGGRLADLLAATLEDIVRAGADPNGQPPP